MIDRLLAILAPHRCLGCKHEGSLWCGDCRVGALAAVERCYKCHRLADGGGRTCLGCRRGGSLYGVWAATRYENTAKQLVWRLKFDGAQAAAAVVADVMADRLILHALPKNAIIVPVPAATSHVRRRGYDQAVLIASHLASRTALPMRPLLVRLGQKQQRGASRQDRLTQLQGAFRVRHLGGVHSDAHVILVDDVVTTGSTLEAAAATLKAAGVKRVEAVIFAQA